MASRKFDLEINVKSKKAEKDLKKFNKTLDDTNKKTKDSKKATDASGSGFSGLLSKLGPVSKALGGVGAVAVAGVAAFNALDQAIRAAAQQARELENMARIADTTVSSFQAMNVVATQFGVTGEKLADQVKDFQDKLGDFTANGAGPFKDIMKLIGNTSDLTAKQLANMAGPQAVGAVIDALDDANLSTSEMKFALESLASDLALTEGAFRNNAQAIADTEQQLDDMNATLNRFEIMKLKEYADATALIDQQWDTFWTKIKLKGLPIMEGLNDIISATLTLFNEDSERDANFLGIDTKAGQVKFLKDEVSELQDVVKEVDSMTTLEKTLKGLSRVGSQAGGGGEGPMQKRANAVAQMAEKYKLIAILEKEIADEAAQREAEIQAGIAERVRINEVYADQFFKILGDQDKMSAGLEEFNNELARTSFIDSKIKNLKENYSPEQLESIRKAYGDFYDERQRLIQVGKDEVETEKQLKKERRELEITTKKLADEEKARKKGFADRVKSMSRELALLNQTNDAQRRKLQLEFEINDLNLDTNEANVVRTLQAQIDARQRHLDILEKEKEAVQSLAEAMGRWASGSKDAIKQVIAELIRLAAIKLFGGTGSFLGGFLSGFGDGGVRGFADGGQFSAGETFMVGERGPEIITASAPGAVIPNHQLSGMPGISISPQLNISGGVNNADELTIMLSNFSNEIASQTQTLIKRQLGPRGVFA